MKYSTILLGGCSAGLVMADLGYYSSDGHVDSILQARSDDLLPGPHYYLARRSGGMAGASLARQGARPQRMMSASKPSMSQGPARKAMSGPGRQSHVASAGDGKSGEEPAAKAFITAKGPATMHATTPNDFKDTYLVHGRKGRISMKDDFSATAGGGIRGVPDENALKKPLWTHDMKGSATGKSVVGHITAPEGSRGSMRLRTSKGKQDFEIPGGTSLRMAATSSDGSPAKVVGTVDRGGSMRVHGGEYPEAYGDAASGLNSSD